MRATDQAPPRSRPVRRGLFIAAAIAFGLLLGGGAAELMLRLSGRQPWQTLQARQNEPVMHDPDPRLGWKPIPGHHVVAPYSPGGPSPHFTFLADGTRTTGARGDRDKVVFVGCSFTQGWAVSDEDTFAWRIQQERPELAVFNYGVTAYGTYQSLLLLERLFAEPDPPRVVFYGLLEEHEQRNVADMNWLLPLALLSKGGIVETPYCTLGNNGDLVRHEPEGYPHWPLREHSALITELQNQYASVAGGPRAAAARPVTERLLLEMRRLVEQHGSRFCVVLLHLSPDTKAHYVEFLAEHQVDFVDCAFPLTPDMRVRGDHHPNGTMHARYAECIAAKMRAAGWVGPH